MESNVLSQPKLAQALLVDARGSPLIEDPLIEGIQEAGQKDIQHTQLVNQIEKGFPPLIGELPRFYRITGLRKTPYRLKGTWPFTA